MNVVTGIESVSVPSIGNNSTDIGHDLVVLASGQTIVIDLDEKIKVCDSYESAVKYLETLQA